MGGAGDNTLRSFFDSAPMMMGIAEVENGDIRHISDNKTAAEYFDIGAEQMQGRFASELGVPRATIALWVRHYVQAERTQKPVRFEYTTPTDATAKILSVAVSYIGKGPTGNPRFSYIAEDVTEIRSAEAAVLESQHTLERRVDERTEELRSSRTQLRAYADSMPQMAFITDAKGQSIFFNRRHFEYFGVPIDSLDAWTEMERTERVRHEADLPAVAKAWNHSLETGEPFEIQYRLRRHDGQYRWHLGRAVPFRDENGKIIRWFGTNTDIHDQKTFSEELAHAKRAAEEANMAKSSFLANMSHEIRTPLGAILGFTDLLKDQALDPRDRDQFLETISRNGRALTRIIDDILDLAKVESGKLEVEHVEFSFFTLVDEVMDLFRERAREKNLYLRLRISDDVPDKICSDPTRLRQILINIVGNALKFTNDGGITILVKAETNAKKENSISVAVTDTGVGVLPENRERLFHPFTQADNATTRKYGGTGLGLSLSVRLAKALGGDIRIDDPTPGIQRGCTFVITFAAKAPSSAGRTVDQGTVRVPFSGTLPLSGMRVLVVDDSTDNQFLVKRLLAKNGAQVETASNGREGLQSALAGQHDVVLMDLQMPEMDGYEATKSLLDAGYDKPIVALTAHAMSEEREITKATGFVHHLTKPLVPEELLKTVMQYGKQTH